LNPLYSGLHLGGLSKQKEASDVPQIMKNKEKEKEAAGKCDEMLPSGEQKGETQKFEMKAKTRLACRLVHAAAFQTTANEIFFSSGRRSRLPAPQCHPPPRLLQRHRSACNSSSPHKLNPRETFDLAPSPSPGRECGACRHPGECGAAILSGFPPVAHTRTHTNTCGGRHSSHTTPTQSVTEVPDI